MFSPNQQTCDDPCLMSATNHEKILDNVNMMKINQAKNQNVIFVRLQK